VQLSCEILGVPVTAYGTGDDVVIEVGDTSFTPAEIHGLAVSHADWTRTATVGEFTFDATGLAALKQVAEAACLAATAESTTP
jgi:hypothetical protein